MHELRSTSGNHDQWKRQFDNLDQNPRQTAQETHSLQMWSLTLASENKKHIIIMMKKIRSRGRKKQRKKQRKKR